MLAGCKLPGVPCRYMALNRQTLIKLEGIKGGRFLHIRASPEPLWSHPQASLRHRPSTILVGGEDVPSFSWGGRHRGCTYLQGPEQGEISSAIPTGPQENWPHVETSGTQATTPSTLVCPRMPPLPYGISSLQGLAASRSTVVWSE